MNSFKKLAGAAALAAVLSAGGGSASAAAILYGTTGPAPGGGSSGFNSHLLLIDATTGATTDLGAIGYTVNGLTWDATTGTLYGSAANDVGLITINTTTGAGTLVGAFNSPAGGCSDRNVLLTSNSAGSLFGWCDPSSDDLMSINKATGAATVVGESGIGTGGHGMAFANNDVLYLYQGGTVYTIDTGTGAASFEGSAAGSSAHHGDFNPDDNLYYGLGAFGITNRMDVYDLVGGNALISTITIDRSDVFTLTFANAVPEPGTFAILGLGLGLLGFARRKMG